MSEQIYHGKELEYSDILLVPGYSQLDTRNNADTSFKLGKFTFNLPVVPSNMETVIDLKLCKQLDDNNYFYIMHRFQDVFETVRQLNELNCNCVSVSIGVNEKSYQELEAIIDNNYKVDIITIDVAHGHHQKVGNMIRYVKRNLPDVIVIAGNVGTYDGFHFLEDSGADVIKVGIGSGVICTTRYKTGFGTPMFSTLLKITSHKTKAKIMADGGWKSSQQHIYKEGKFEEPNYYQWCNMRVNTNAFCTPAIRFFGDKIFVFKRLEDAKKFCKGSPDRVILKCKVDELRIKKRIIYYMRCGDVDRLRKFWKRRKIESWFKTDTPSGTYVCGVCRPIEIIQT